MRADSPGSRSQGLAVAIPVGTLMAQAFELGARLEPLEGTAGRDTERHCASQNIESHHVTALPSPLDRLLIVICCFVYE